jgi:peroxiredoxin
VDSSANEPAGAYSLWDGTRVGVYEPTRRTWASGTPAEVGLSPSLPLWGELAWGDGQWLNDDPKVRYIPCDGAQALPGMTILGHETDHIVCTDIDMEYWLDRETHMVLRMEPGPNTPHWDGTAPGGTVVEATAFELGPRPAAEFAWSGPPGAYAPDKVPASLVLADGAPLPSWSGKTATGERFDTADVGLPAVYLFAATWCPPCDAEYDAVVAGLRDRPSLNGVIVSNDPAGNAAGYAAAHAVTVPVIADPDNVFGTAWGITSYPTLLTLDATGRVSSIVSGGLRAADVDRVLDAAAAGGPVPSVAPAPEDELWPEEPSPSFTVEGTPRPRILAPAVQTDLSRVTGVPFGAVVPSFSGPRMDGGTFDSSELRGRPAIIALWSVGAWADTNLDDFAKAMQPIGDDIAVVIVLDQEETPGATAAMFAEHGYTFPVVFDWEGRIALALNQQTSGTLVLDPQGRLVDERIENPGLQPSLEELRKIAKELAP